ncbi:toxin-antitoxin system YwqK family antitoxin [Streptomyces sp. NPDC057579]|uniref:toxin-antitoxin system YwqK family antitoxin n=1 Tax=unclassified Streptomyces TaxID=2593676 RepID=UPI0036BC50DE
MRVDEEDTYMEDDMRVYYEGEPFEGEVVTRDEEGRMISLVSYLWGVESGPQTHWHPDGTKKEEGTCSMGLAIGEWRRWHPNGQLAERSVFSPEGRHLFRQRWDKGGNPTVDKCHP